MKTTSYETWYPTRDEAEAALAVVHAVNAEDARLRRMRASAPELAEAVRGLLKLHEAHHNSVEHAAARALLRKIEGAS